MTTVRIRATLIYEDAPIENAGVGWGGGPVLHERTIHLGSAGTQRRIDLDTTYSAADLWAPSVPTDDDSIEYRNIALYATTNSTQGYLGMDVRGVEGVRTISDTGFGVGDTNRATGSVWIGTPYNKTKGVQHGVYHPVTKTELGSES